MAESNGRVKWPRLWDNIKSFLLYITKSNYLPADEIKEYDEESLKIMKKGILNEESVCKREQLIVISIYVDVDNRLTL